MEIQTNFSLKNHNTFGIEASAKQFVAVHDTTELKTILEQNKTEKKFILGGGSNMLLTKDIDALVIHIDLKGKKIIKEDEDFVWVESQAGENWHEFVLWTIDQNLGGLENTVADWEMWARLRCKTLALTVSKSGYFCFLRGDIHRKPGNEKFYQSRMPFWIPRKHFQKRGKRPIRHYFGGFQTDETQP